VTDGLWIVSSALLAVALLSATEGFVIYELIHQLAQIRRRLDLDDETVVQSLGTQIGQPVSLSMARALTTAMQAPSLFAVFVTTDCTTCQLVAGGARGLLVDLPSDVAVRFIVQARRVEDAELFNAETNLPEELVVVDEEARLGQELDLRMRPLTLLIRDGRLTEAAVVRNPEQLRKFIKRWTSREEERIRDTASPLASANV
jgi:hypothetical protein